MMMTFHNLIFTNTNNNRKVLHFRLSDWNKELRFFSFFVTMQLFHAQTALTYFVLEHDVEPNFYIIRLNALNDTFIETGAVNNAN